MRLNPQIKPHGYRKIRTPPERRVEQTRRPEPTESIKDLELKIDRKFKSRKEPPPGFDSDEDIEHEEEVAENESMDVSWDFDDDPKRAHSRKTRRHNRFKHRSKSPRVITTKFDKVQESEKKPVKGKKQVLMGLLVVVIIILAGAGLYYLALPRVDVELITIYHEATGGASSSGFINVNLQINNKGTRALEDVNVTISVIQTDTNNVVAGFSDLFYQINRGEFEEPALDFMGDHYQAYNIEVHIEFSAAGKIYDKNYGYDISENSAMNLIFRENISAWAF